MKTNINKLKNTNKQMLKYSGIYPVGGYVSLPVTKINHNSTETMVGRTKAGGYVALPVVKQSHHENKCRVA